MIRERGSDGWCNKGRVKCYHVYVIMHVKQTQLSIVRIDIVSR